jgi:hypothetical protein
VTLVTEKTAIKETKRAIPSTFSILKREAALMRWWKQDLTVENNFEF